MEIPLPSSTSIRRRIRLRDRRKRKSTQQRSYRRVLKSGSLRARGVDETYRYFGPGLFPQSGGLSVGLPGAHAGPRIHPLDRRGPLQRRLHDQLGIQRVSGHPRTHLRSPLRAGLPARPRRERAGRDLPAQARRRRFQGRHPRPAAESAGKEERQAHRARRRRSGLACGGARSGADGLHLRGVRPGPEIRRHDADANSEIPLAGNGHRRGMRLHPQSRHRIHRRQAHRQPEGAARGRF